MLKEAFILHIFYFMLYLRTALMPSCNELHSDCFFAGHFSGAGRAIRQLSVCVCPTMVRNVAVR